MDVEAACVIVEKRARRLRGRSQ